MREALQCAPENLHEKKEWASGSRLPFNVMASAGRNRARISFSLPRCTANDLATRPAKRRTIYGATESCYIQCRAVPPACRPNSAEEAVVEYSVVPAIFPPALRCNVGSHGSVPLSRPIRSRCFAALRGPLAYQKCQDETSKVTPSVDRAPYILHYFKNTNARSALLFLRHGERSPSLSRSFRHSPR